MSGLQPNSRSRKGQLPAITLDYKLTIDMPFLAPNTSAPGSYSASRVNSTNGQRIWRIHRVSGKMIEAKSLVKHEDQPNYYCIARLDNQIANQVASMSVSNTDNPFWAEEFQFDAKNGFRNIEFIVMMERTDAGINHSPVGKTVIPKKLIKSAEEQTYLLFDASQEWKATGSVLLNIRHFPPKPPRKIHGFSVNVQKAKDLDKNGEDIPNPFAVLHLLPDPEAITTQHTRTADSTNSPKSKETFFFTCSESSDFSTREINCAIWSQTDGISYFVGHVSIPLAHVVEKGIVNRWYMLHRLENDANFLMSRSRNKKQATEDERKNKGAKEMVKEEEKSDKTRDFIKRLHSSGTYRLGAGSGTSALSERAHNFIEKSFVLTPCFVCGTHMMGAHSYCTDCHVNVHQKCEESLPATCTSVGALRVKVVHQKLIAFSNPTYTDLITLLKKDDYFLLNHLGKVSSSREDVAKCMIRIFGPSFHDFVKNVVQQEIMQSPESKTLFRANSMASKALDVYMKYVGMEYLYGTIEDVLKLFVVSKKGFEMDPTRLESGIKDKKGKYMEETLEGNTANLIELTIIVSEYIYKSASKLPIQLRDVFFLIQKTVMERFPDDGIAKYTAVSGFLFLRFFTPAILGPHLFGLRIGVRDLQSTRKLCLIAKTLQNVSNFVEFGQKEPFMEPMNGFIQSTMPSMKKFIDEVSQPLTAEEVESLQTPEFKEEYVAQDSAELVLLLAASMDRLVSASNPPHPLVLELQPILKQIEEKVEEIEKMDQARKEKYEMDMGIDLRDENLDVSALNPNDEARMLTTLANIQSEQDNGDANNNPTIGLKDMRKSACLTAGTISSARPDFFDLKRKDERTFETPDDNSDDEFSDIPVIDGKYPNPFASTDKESEIGSISMPATKRRTSKQFFGNLLGSSQATESPVLTPNTKRRGSAMGLIFGASQPPNISIPLPTTTPSITPSLITPTIKRRGSMMAAFANTFSSSSSKELTISSSTKTAKGSSSDNRSSLLTARGATVAEHNHPVFMKKLIKTRTYSSGHHMSSDFPENIEKEESIKAGENPMEELSDVDSITAKDVLGSHSEFKSQSNENIQGDLRARSADVHLRTDPKSLRWDNGKDFALDIKSSPETGRQKAFGRKKSIFGTSFKM